MNHDTHAALACIREIADLVAWCRRLSQAGPRGADPAELAAYGRAKHALLARLDTEYADTEYADTEYADTDAEDPGREDGR